MGVGNSKSWPEGYDDMASDSEKLKKACAALDGDAREALLIALQTSTPREDAPLHLPDLLRFIDAQALTLQKPLSVVQRFVNLNDDDPFSPSATSPLMRPFPGFDASEEDKDQAVRDMAEFTEWWVQTKEFSMPFPGYLPPFKRLGGTPLDVTDFVTTRYHAWRSAGFNRGSPYANGLLGLPRFHDTFDWWLTNSFEQQLVGKGFLRDGDPKRILVSLMAHDGETVEKLLRLLEKRADPSHRERTVIFGGGDRRLSDQDPAPLHLLVRKWASRVLWEAKDVELTLDSPSGPVRVETMPIGLTENYYRRIAPQVNAAINSTSIATKTRQPCVLAAWGAAAQGVGRPESIDTRALADELASRCPELVDRRRIPWDQYWTELKTYRFLLYPQGDGVQSPKYAEAILTFVIPIALRCPAFDDLKKSGLPIVVVDSFDEVTQENLDKWWAEISPTLEEARARMLVDNYVKEFC